MDRRGDARPADSARAERRAWAMALYRRSVLKQEKYRQIVALLGDVEGRRCLDIGGDNGVISLLLRERGGCWHSADLDETAVAAIRQVVGTNVQRVEEDRTPFADQFFDVIVVADFLEHTRTDRAFARDLWRILKPGGTLIVNVPHLKSRSLLYRIRPLVGLTDEKHGHVRPGYDLRGLRTVLGSGFTIEESRTYSRSFSEAVDTALNAAVELRGRWKRRPKPSRKGRVITEADLQAASAEYRLLSLLYPLIWLFSRLDRALFLQSGYKLIVRATRQSSSS